MAASQYESTNERKLRECYTVPAIYEDGGQLAFLRIPRVNQQTAGMLEVGSEVIHLVPFALRSLRQK